MSLNEKLLVLILFLSPIKCQETQYEYSIEVPKYLCDRNESVKNGITKIRLLGKDAQKLQYDFTVDFRNSNNCKHQRCTLMTWRAVRNLEKYLNRVCATQENLQEISINNTMLIPGIQYVLNIAVTSKGTPIDTKQFMLECTNETSVVVKNETVTANKTVNENENQTVATTTIVTTTTTTTAATSKISIVNDTVIKNETAITNTASSMNFEQSFPTSFILVGANITYRDMLYILNAETEGCYVNCNYYFKWEILDSFGNLYRDDYTRGSELQIFPEFLKVEEVYTIKCTLINGQDNTVIATVLQKLKVLKRDMILKLAVSTLLVGIKKPFKLAAYFQNIDNPDGKITTKWSCKSENQKDCLGFEKIRYFNQDKSNMLSLESNGLLNVGSYLIALTVSDDNSTKQNTCTLKLVENGFVKIDIDSFEEPVDPSKDIEVSAYVSGLIASCTLQWTNIKLPNYKYLDQSARLGNINILTNISVIEDEFLNEIDEFSNNTIDMEYNLKIPPPKDGLNWKGLESNSSYLFRLNATCPTSQEEEDSDEDAEPLIIQNYATLYADVVLHTDSLPVLNSLDLVPKKGVALKTLFRFICEDGGSNSNYPILYKFGYFLKDEIIFVSNFLGVTSTKSVLPYINEGVKTVLEGCNSHSLCSKVLGPVIITEIPTISEEDHNNLMGRLRELMGREEYYKMFAYSLAILQTYNSTNDKNLITSMENFISNLTSHEIKRLLMKSVDGDTSWTSPANNLIKNIGLLLNKFSASQILLNNIVALRNELSRKNNLKLEMENFKYLSRRMLTLTDEMYSRRKRDVDKMTLEEVKNYLAISELIITTSPDRRRVQQERENLMNQVDKFMPSLCAHLYYKSRTMNLELKTLILSVEKISKNTFNRYIHILFPENTWNINGRMKLGKCFTEKLKMDDQLCLGKIVFKNYLNKKGFVYMVKIYNAGSNDQLDLQELICDSVLIFPVDEKQILEKEAKCVFWKRYWSQAQCKTLQMKNRVIQCACTNLGYYSLEYVTPTPATSVSSTLADIIETSTSANSTISVDTPSSIEIPTITTKTVETSTMQTHTEAVAEYNFKTTKHTSTTTASEQITTMETLPKTNEVSNNVSLATLHTFQYENLTVHYFIIGTSLCGVAFLIYGIRRLLRNGKEVSNDDFPRYAPLYHEEMLHDLPPTK